MISEENSRRCQFCRARFVPHHVLLPLSAACDDCREAVLRQMGTIMNDHELKTSFELFYGQFYAGMCAVLQVVETHIGETEELFKAVLETVPDLDELVKACERRGEYRLAGRIRRYAISQENAERSGG